MPIATAPRPPRLRRSWPTSTPGCWVSSASGSTTRSSRSGGDSLSAMRVIATINVAFDIHLSVRTLYEAPSVRSLSQRLGIHASSVEVVPAVSPAGDLQDHADDIEAERKPGAKRPSFASVHDRDSTEVHAGDLTLDKFLDATTLTAAPTLPGPSAEVRTVLLTGATGFLGRYLALEWLARMELVDGTLICLVRAKSDEEARRRLDKTFDSGDPALLRALPGTGRRSSGGHRRRQGRSQPGPGPADLAAAGRHRRSDRRPRSPGQPRPALQPAVRAQRRGHRRADPHRTHHQAQALRLRVDCRRGPPDRAVGVHRGCRHPGHQPHPHQSTTATTTASGPARCCCARPTICAGCRSRCFAAT